MKIRTLLVSLLIVAATSFCLNAASQKDAPATKNDDKFIVYYFHTTGRCPTCLKMEKYTDEALKTYYSKELKSGKIEWKVIDVETPGNDHFIKDYSLYTKSVVISHIKGSKEIGWKNLDKIWTKVRDKNDYLAYIKQEVGDFMKGGK